MEKPAVTQHCLLSGHHTKQNNLTILKEMNTTYYVIAWETCFINYTKKEDLMNTEEGTIRHYILHTNFL